MSMDGDIERILWTAEDIAARISELGVQISDDFRRSPSPVIVVGVATGAFLFLADIVRQITLPIAVDFIRAESYGSGTKSNGAPTISCDLKLDISGKHVLLLNCLKSCHTWRVYHVKWVPPKANQLKISVCAIMMNLRSSVAGLLRLLWSVAWLMVFRIFLLRLPLLCSSNVVEDIVDTGATLSRLILYLKSKGACSVSVCTLLDKPARRRIHFELVGDGKFYRGFECPDAFVVGYGLDLAELYRNLSYIGVLKPEKYN